MWITNRQQGKTTTLSKFIAALAIASIAGGNLIFVYSTGLDRAQEVVKASRAVIDWLRATSFAEQAGYPKIRIARDNERMFGVRNPAGGVNEVLARPRTVESCRGDNPWAVVVDEIAFTKKDWFYRFLQPLTQVRSRRFTYIVRSHPIPTPFPPHPPIHPRQTTPPDHTAPRGNVVHRSC